MSEKIPDLWPDDIAVADSSKFPVIILRQQATLLGQKTQNIVEGEVRSIFDDIHASPKKTYFGHEFNIVAPALGNYRFRLFNLEHSDDVYPSTIYISEEREEGEKAIIVESDEGLIEALREIFATEKTKRIIHALIAQSQA